MTNFAGSLVQNLKELNAKERDHLMRLAYLGVAHAYEENSDSWLSKAMLDALECQLAGTGLGSERRCVFAAMDYQLSWFHAAIFRTCNEGKCSGPLDDRSSCKDNSLRPVTRSPEDFDLLVVFADDRGNVVILCVEAKGVASIDKKQLARKMIRLDRILAASGAKGAGWVTCKLVLMGPDARKPSFKDCLTHARALPLKPEMKELRDYLANPSFEIGCDVDYFVELKGFPVRLKTVTRKGPPTESEEYSRWEIKNRPVPRSINSSAGADRCGTAHPSQH